MDFHPGRNIYLTSWFILSVLFLTDHEMSVVPTLVQDPPSQVVTPILVGRSTSPAGSCCLCRF